MIKNANNSYSPVILFLLAALVWRTSYYIYSLYVIIPIIIVYCFYNYRKAVIYSTYFKPYLFILFWMSLSSLVNENASQSFSAMIPIFASFLLSMSIYSIAYKNKYSRFIFFAYVALFVFLMVQNMQSGGFTMDFDYANEVERRENSQLNANVYAYYSLFAIIGWRMFILCYDKKNKPLVMASLYLLSIALIFYVALMTASRQVMALEIPLLLYFFYFDFIRGGKKKIVLLLLGIVMFALLPYFSNLYNNSYLAVRSEVGFQDDSRSSLMIDAIILGLENPFWGLGLGANTDFSHCSYTHLLSRTGIPVFIVFLYIILNSIIVQWKRFRQTRDVSYLYYLGSLGIMAIGHFTYSYIQEPFMMAIMFGVIGISDNNYKKCYVKK